MSNLLDFQRLSNFVSGIVDRKIRAVSIGITSSNGYLKGLVTQAQTFSQAALDYSTAAGGSATEADTAAASALIVWNQFTSTYAGLLPNDPSRSSQGNPINAGAFYIRSTDGRLRYASIIDGSGNPVWLDATVTADPTSLAAAGVGVFLSLQTTALQTVKSPITFQTTVLGPQVTSWTSNQYTTAKDVNDRITTVTTAITTETTRATAAETAINAAKVSKAGDIMSGVLQIVAGGDTASLSIRNNNSLGRLYRWNSSDDGRFRLVDDNATAERISITSTGTVTIAQALIGSTSVASPALIVNRTDGNDSTVAFQTTGVTRWSIGRTSSGQRFYISRFNASGVFIDSPVSVAEADGSLTLNKTAINDSLTTKGNIQVNSVGAAIGLNNTAGVTDTSINFQHLGFNRWAAGRSAGQALFYINQYTDTGGLVGTPFLIRESNGWVQVNNLQVAAVLQATTSITAPIIMTSAGGTGRNVAIGDDVWIGDSNIPNGLSIRGQSDFNAGFIQFGNSGTSLGCNASDATLRYGSFVLYHTGNLDLSPYATNASVDTKITAATSSINGTTDGKIAAAIAPYATTASLNSAIGTVNTSIDTKIAAAISPYATTAALNGAVSTINTSVDSKIAGVNTLTDSKIASAIVPYATNASVDSKISTVNTLTDSKIATAIVPYATNASVDSKISTVNAAIDTKIAAMITAQFPSGSNANGYWFYQPDGAGGRILTQRGFVRSIHTEGSTAVTFPITFPDLASVVINLTIVGTTVIDGGGNDMWMQLVDGWTASTFSAMYQSHDAGNFGRGFMWEAVGKG